MGLLKEILLTSFCVPTGCHWIWSIFVGAKSGLLSPGPLNSQIIILTIPLMYALLHLALESILLPYFAIHFLHVYFGLFLLPG